MTTLKLNNKSLIAALVLCIVLLALVLACTQQTPPAAPTTNQPKPLGPQYGGTLRTVAQYDIIGFLGYPPKSTGATSMKQSVPVLETLFRTDKEGKVIPHLATGFKNDVTTNSITLTLQKGVKFHDGTDFNAEAVKWNLDQCMQAKSLGTQKFKSIDVIDDSTIRITLSSWDITVPSNLAQNLGMMISPASFKKNSEDWAAANPIGTGPFQFVSWSKDVKTIYKKFDGYWQKGKPYVDSIEHTIVLDSTVRLLSLKKGDFDLSHSVDMKDLADLRKEGFSVIRRSVGSGAFAMAPDSANPSSPWADIRVRQAAQYAIDTDAMVKALMGGEAETTNQWIFKGHWGYNPAVVGYSYNPAKAKQLLADAGYPNGFPTTIHYSVSPQFDQLFTAIQGYLKAVNIDAKLDPLQVVKINQISQSQKWDGLLHTAQSSNPDLAAGLDQNFSGKWFTAMSIPDELKTTIQNAIAAPDFATEQKYCQEAMKLISDKYCLLTLIFISSPSGAVVSQANVHDHGVCDTPNSGQWTPENVWMEKK